MAAQRDDMAGTRAADPAPDNDRIVLDDPAAGEPVAGEPATDEPAAEEPAAAGGPVVVVADVEDVEDVDEVQEVRERPDTTPAAALAEQQWPAIQAMFVDDPRGAVERAAAAAGEVAASLIAALEREQTELRASWQQDADTERLRTALQRYRAFCGRVEGLA